MTTMKSWGLPTDPIAGIHFGDHTWVTADDNQNCWPILGGGKRFYCDGRWNGKTYVPPVGTHKGKLVTAQELTSAAGISSKAECMGGKEWKFMDRDWLPVYAGILYGFHGVCHQMANRLLLSSGQIVVRASGFPLSAAAYGIYGTRIPGAAWALIPAVLLPAALAYSYGINAAFERYCRECHVAYPGPILAAERATQSPKESLLFDHELHMQELATLFERLAAGRVDETKLHRMLEVYDTELRPDPETIDRVSEAAQMDPEAVADAVFDPIAFADGMNADVLARQDEVANVLGARDYQILFHAHPDERIGVVDPRIIRGEMNVSPAT